MDEGKKENYHKSLRAAIQKLYDESELCVMDVHVEWKDVSTQGAYKMLITKVETMTVTRQ